jgi:hypothetical protein
LNRLDLAHVAFPRDHRPVVYLAQLVVAGDGECRHEMPHVEPVRPAGARALLFGEPDFFLGNVGEPFDHRGRFRLVVVVGSDDLRRGCGHGWPEFST